MRELNHEAEQHCLEYKKLRAMMPTRRVLALHKAVACQAGHIADDTRREETLAHIYQTFDIDPSVYRPLIAMVREDPPVAAEIARLDVECAPAFGPAVPR